ncbi:MAG: RluA family pseudouridine synthase [Gallionella sp.]|nr:RluA family pseudouridine synthase [Gallionella sp.]
MLNYPTTACSPPALINLELLYQDAFLLVVNKPAGLLSVPGRGADKTDSLATRVQVRFADALIVHRLDRDTSGLLVLARGAAMHRLLSMAFAAREVNKRYVARVAGKPEQTAGEINLPIIVDWPNRPKQHVNYATGKPSLTRYSLLNNDDASNTSLLELEPVTGRTHQLRVHLSAIGHPILGDTLYGGDVSNAAERLLLHARLLSFTHPHSNAPLQFICEPPF